MDALPFWRSPRLRLISATARPRESTVSTSSFSEAEKSAFSFLRRAVASARSASEEEIFAVTSSIVLPRVAI